MLSKVFFGSNACVEVFSWYPDYCKINYIQINGMIVAGSGLHDNSSYIGRSIRLNSISVIEGVHILNSNGVKLYTINFNDFHASTALEVDNSNVMVEYCLIDNHDNGIEAKNGSRVILDYCTTVSGHSEYCLNSESGSIIIDLGTNTLEATNRIATGGTILPYILFPTLNQSTQPSNTEIPAGGHAFWTDTDDSKCYLCYNHGGTVKKVELT